MSPERPPQASPPPLIEESTYNAGLSWPVVIAIVLILIALVTVFLLPDWLQVASSETDRVVSENTVAGSKLSDSQAMQARQDAETNLANALEARARLENQRAGSWANKEVAQIMQTLKQADDALAKQRYVQASEFYIKAITEIDALLASKPSRLTDSLAAAKMALANEASRDSGPQALTALKAALAIQPDHGLAQSMLARAKLREPVQSLFFDAKQAVKTSELTKAVDLLGQALKLDVEFGLASTLRSEIVGQQRAQGFKQQLSTGLNALDKGDVTTAQRAFRQARSLLSKTPSSDDAAALKQAYAALQRARVGQQLKGLRQQAERAESIEDWSAAIKLYEQAKALDGAANFAQSGLQRATQLRTLNQQIRHYLQRPERLNSTEPLNNARQVLKNAQALNPQGSKTKAQVARLQRLLLEAGSPVTVTLQSDDNTEVLIQYLGRIGKFVQHKHSLVPGTYTFIGSRIGYRDVRITRSIKHSDPDPVIQIRCEEPI